MIKHSGLLLLILAFISCSNEDMTFQIGSKYVEVNTNIRYIDTITVHSFTVKMDSISTSDLNQPAMLIGRFTDPEFGTFSAGSFFRLNPPNSIVLPNDAVYDSIQLIMLYNGYAVGDTNAVYTINAHRLTKALKKREDGKLYNTSVTDFDPVPLGTVSLVPWPNTYDTLWMRLDDVLGKELFNLIDDKDPIVKESEQFLNYFKGFALNFDEADKAVIGFDFPTTATVTDEITYPTMRLYYHYFDFEYVDKYIDFPVGSMNLSYQYNRIIMTDPVVDFPSDQRDKLPAGSSDSKTYIQAGTGLVTRIEIPYLKNLLALHDNVIVMKAELQIEPVRNSYHIFPLPENIAVYASDRINRFRSTFIASAELSIDNVYQEETWYTIDVTEFIKDKLLEQSEETPALLVTIAPENLNKTFDRAVLGSQNHSENRVKLKVYYLNYE